MAGYINGKVEIFCGDSPPLNLNLLWYKRTVINDTHYYGMYEYNIDENSWQLLNTSESPVTPPTGDANVFGPRVLIVKGDVEAGYEKQLQLLNTYSLAKTMTPTQESPINILLPPGSWGVYSTFILDTPYINILSSTGMNDVVSSYASWEIRCDNITIRGVSWNGARLRICGDYPNVLIENCGGYIAGPSTGDPVNISSTFRNINSIGYQTFFHDGIIELSGVFENIKCGSGFSLGSVGAGSKLSGKFINCTSTGSGVFIADELSGLFVNCSGNYNSFIGNITGKMYDCIATQGFSTISSGVVRRCTLEGSGFTFPTPSAGGKVQLCIDSSTV